MPAAKTDPVELKARKSARDRRRHATQRDARLAAQRKWHADNKARVAIRHKRWVAANRWRVNERMRLRDAHKLRAIPPWADRAAIKVFYQRAAQLTAETGIKHEVDHIVPLAGKTVSGLHWEGNLQILTKSANAAKWNTWPPP